MSNPFGRSISLVALGASAALACELAGPTELVLSDPDLTEVSGLLRLPEGSTLLHDGGFRQGVLMVSDEGPVERALAVAGESARGWQLRPLRADLAAPAQTDDAEALAHDSEYVYIVGSHFGRKGGPLQQSRHFIARFPLHAAAGGVARLEIVNTAFLLHRLANDAFAARQLDLIERSQQEIAAFITRAPELSGSDPPEIADRVRPGDWPINVEGAAFSSRGSLLLGLRYPVTRAGDPIVLELGEPDLLFSDLAKAASELEIWTLCGVGDPETPRGIRALETVGDTLHVLSGSLDGGSRSAIARGHGSRAEASSEHHVVPLAGPEGRCAERVLGFDADDVEGLAELTARRFVYSRDDDDAAQIVQTRSWPARIWATLRGRG